MATYTKPQILNFLETKSLEAWRGATTPQEASMRFFLLRITKILVEKDVITAEDINAAFPEFP